MMPIVEEIKKKIDIVEFIGSLITLKKAGRNFKANCPFHQEKTASFVVSPDRQIWHCFGSCQDGGDIIKFLMKWDNVTFGEAVKLLAQKAGIKIATNTFEDDQLRKKERLFRINSLAADYFQFVLFKTNIGEKARTYLSQRGINDSIIQTFGLGYAPQSWDSLSSFLLKKKFTSPELDEVGLTVKGERGSSYDRFRGRLVFPIKDARENVIGFSGRILDEGDKTAKYINTPESPIYHKRESLFGIHLAKDSIKKEGFVILVEGEFDVITPYQHGIENVVAVKGSAITTEQLSLLKRYTNRIVFALDADATGEEAVKRGTEEAERLDFEIEVLLLDFAKDPDEAVRKDFAQFKRAIKNKIPVYDFILQSLIKKYSIEDPFGKKHIGDEMTVFLEKIQNPIVQSHYIKKTAQLLNVSESSLERTVRFGKRKKNNYQSFVHKPKDATDKQARETVLQKYLLSFLFQSKDEILPEVLQELRAEDFSIPSYGKLFDEFVAFRNAHPVQPVAEFLKTIKKELVPVFDELYLFATYEEAFQSDNTARLVFEIKKNSIKREISNLTQKEDLSSEEEAQVQKLSAKLKEVEKKLFSL